MIYSECSFKLTMCYVFKSEMWKVVICSIRWMHSILGRAWENPAAYLKFGRCGTCWLSIFQGCSGGENEIGWIWKCGWLFSRKFGFAPPLVLLYKGKGRETERKWNVFYAREVLPSLFARSLPRSMSLQRRVYQVPLSVWYSGPVSAVIC